MRIIFVLFFLSNAKRLSRRRYHVTVPRDGTTLRYHVTVSRDWSYDNIDYFSTNFLGPLVSWDASHESEEMHDARESDYGDIMYKRSAPKPSYIASGKVFK